MRILHVTTFLQGGAGRMITALAVAQKQAGHDVRLVADAGGELGYATYPEYTEALVAAGIDVILVNSTFKRDPDLNRRAADEVRRLATTWAPDIVHAHAATPAVVARLSGICAGTPHTPLIQTMHGWGTSKTHAQVAQDLDALERADQVTMPSRSARDWLRSIGLRRREVRVIAYGLPDIDTHAVPDAADARIIQSRRARVALCIGTICARKNQQLLVDLLATTLLRDAVGVFIGDGDEEMIRKRALARGVANRVIVLGRRPLASRYFGLADVLVLPSRNEGLPIAALEALRAGVPIVGSNIPEIAEAVGPDLSTFLSPPDDHVRFARAMRMAFDLADKSALAARLRARFARLYRHSRMVDDYEALYHRETRIASPV